MEKELRYFNFPIQLLNGFIEHHSKVLSDILDYALYEHSLKLEHGTELQRLEASAKYFNVSLGSANRVLKDGKAIYNRMEKPCVMVGISLEMYWDYKSNEKSEWDNICLLGFLGLKSIIQSKSYCKIDNKFWLARMDGKAKSCEYAQLSDTIKKYANEYQTKKIKIALRNGWWLVTYSRYTRGFYISFKMSLESLILEAESRRLSTKEKQFKLREKDAVDNALRVLGVNTTK